MKQLRAKAWLVFILIWAGTASVVQAQAWYHYAPPPSEFDWELFAPMSEFDFAETPASSDGFFFTASRAKYWVSRPDRVAVGSTLNRSGQSLADNPQAVFIPNHVVTSYYTLDDTNSLSSALTQATDVGSFGLQVNSITDAVAETSRGWGNRIDFGWVQDDTIRDSAAKTGWMVSILTGIDANTTQRLGFDDKRIDQVGAAQGIPGVNGQTGVTAPTSPVNGINAIIYEEGLTTVHINFADPFGLLLGFTSTATGLPGAAAPQDLDGDGVITSGNFLATGVGDEYPLAVVFDDVALHNRTKISGAEILAIRREKKLHGNASAEMFLGARFLKVDDSFQITARGGTLADFNARNEALNRIIGPEFGLQITKRSRRWSTVLSGRFMAGANFSNIRQQGTIGDHTSASPEFAGVTHRFGGADFLNRLRNERFSPVGEFRVQTSFNVTRAIKLNAAWEGMVVGGISRGANTLEYALPTMGIIDKTEELFAHGVSVGFEVNR